MKIILLQTTLAIIVSFFTCSCSLITEDSNNCTGLEDYDGNCYETIQIGSQVWMAENLKVTHYRNGDEIQNITDDSQWTNLNTGAFCVYNNDNGHKAKNGLLYNWYALSDTRNIAPDGWHVPTDEEWKELEKYLGMSLSESDENYFRGTDEGDKLKATNGWNNNGNGSNRSGFSALPSGYRYYYYGGTFGKIGQYGYWWTASEYNNSNKAWSRTLVWYSSVVIRNSLPKSFGLSVRLVRD